MAERDKDQINRWATTGELNIPSLLRSDVNRRLDRAGCHGCMTVTQALTGSLRAVRRICRNLVALPQPRVKHPKLNLIPIFSDQAR